MAAGLQLKNYLTSKNPEIKLQYQTMWLSFDPAVRLHIKNMVLSTLGTEPAHHRSAAQCIAYMAATELPQGQWPELISVLLMNITNAQSTEALKEASLESIGYICEDIDSRFLAVQANEILTAIVQGMRKEEPSNSVRLAATKALYNSLEFTKANFEKESERHFIMQVVCEATQCPSTQVQVSALQCLVKIMSLYYQYMESYMGPALFAITLEGMKSNHDEIALQGIEFWSTVCDEEADLAIEAAEAQEQGRPPAQISKFYVKGAMRYLVPILMLTLTKQEEYDDEDDWNPCKAAGVCLSLMASCCEDEIVELAVPFINEHIKSQDWKFRDAAVMALGSILEGPEPSTLQQHVTMLMESLIELMTDSTVQVRDSAAWTTGRICEQVPLAVLNDQYLIKLLNALASGLQGEPRVATNVCWAFSSLAEAAYDNAQVDAEDEEPNTYCLSGAFETIIAQLIATTDRPDAGTGNLRSSAYEALMDMIKYCAKDCYPVVQKTTLLMMERLQQVLALDGQVTGADRQQLTDLESLLCATLQSLLRKVNESDAKGIADTVMTSLILMFRSSLGQTGGVQEDAIMTVGVLVEAIGEGFVNYMELFCPYLLLALKNYVEYQVCIAAVGLVGDLCRALTVKMLPYCDDIMQILLENLSSAAVHRQVKPQILSAIGDIALAIGPEFKKYLELVFKILRQAAQLNVQVDKSDYEMIDYLNELRDGCLEAYTGIVQGLKGDNENVPINPDVKLVWPHVTFMVQFVDHIAKDDEHSDSNIACSAGLLGDLCTCFSKSMLPLLQPLPAISRLLAAGKHSRTRRTKTLCQWALKEMKIIQQQS